MVDINNDLYSGIGYIVVLGMKYIFIPIGVGVSIAVIAHKLLQPLPKRQKKKRFKLKPFSLINPFIKPDSNKRRHP